MQRRAALPRCPVGPTHGSEGVTECYKGHPDDRLTSLWLHWSSKHAPLPRKVLLLSKMSSVEQVDQDKAAEEAAALMPVRACSPALSVGSHGLHAASWHCASR